MKRCLIVFMFVMLSVAGGCVRNLPVDRQSLAEMLEDLLVDDDFVFIDSNGDQGIGIRANRIEMLDFSTAGRVLIQIIVSTDLSSLNEDYMIMIDETFMYSTKTMTKWQHHETPVTRQDYQWLAMDVTRHFHVDWLDLTHLKDQVHALNEPRLHRTQDIHVLRGMVATDEDLPDNVVRMMEIRFTAQYLLEWHDRLEHTFDSTKQHSNYIEGIHVYFSPQMTIDFPFSATFVDITI